MAFDLKANNASGISVITEPNASLKALPTNFTTLYSYAQIEQPELIKELMYANGKGSILGFIQATTDGRESSFESDTIQHGEMGRTMLTMAGVLATGNNFTCPKPHGLRVRDVVLIINGVTEFQAIVSAVTSPTVFVALSDGAAFTFSASAVTVQMNFSNRSLKGDNAFDKGKSFKPTIYTNFAQIVRSFHEFADSEAAQKIWIDTKAGPQWVHEDMEINSTIHDNICELTSIFHKRALDNAPSTVFGFAQGQKGIVQQVEERGNVSNDYISTVGDLSDMALRAKRQGTCREFTVYCDHTQMRKFRELSASVNSAFLNGSNYGAFQNSKDMALKLDFVSIFLDGVQFHFCSWALLDDPSLIQAAAVNPASLAYLMVPTGKMNVTENGNAVSKPYITMRYRKNNMVDRRRQTKFFGMLGQQVREDRSSVEILTELTNQVVGANNFFVGRKGIFYS